MRTLAARGFTFLEILFSLVVFSAGMLAYMNYQGRASAMLFDTESSAIATSLAIEAAEEINSLSEDDFRTVITSIGTLPATLDDVTFKASSSLFQFTPGPFDEFGRPVASGGNSVFYRGMRVRTFNEFTNNNYEVNSPLEVLRIVEVIVAWPNKDSLAVECNTFPFPAGCNSLWTHVVKPIYYY